MNASCTLVFPHQLFVAHPAMQAGRPVVLLEDGLFFGDPHVRQRFHAKKLVLHRASMKAYAGLLKGNGVEVSYRDHQPGKTLKHHLASLYRQGVREVHYCDPVDDLLSRRLQRAFDSLSMNGVAYASPMFLTPTDALERCFRGKRKPLMGRFYQEQRCRLGILVENDGSPIGGKWSFDAENRKPMPKRGLDVPPLAWPEASHEVDQAVARVNRRYPESLGQAEGFAYPVTHAEAERWLEGFLRERLSQFGDYEDAIGEREAFLFHGVLTPMLNVGLLTPQQVIDGALRQAEEGAVPLNSLEGLVRQVIGWREFMRGAYLHLGVASRNANFWGFEDRPIPQAFYEGTTGIPPVDTVIQRVMTHGWCHHIERLMVLGNFMMLCGLHPHRVYQWFMECFVDAYDWVMVPNVYGMSQFADGGFFTTKPYLSGSNYVRKMSDFRPGEWCEVWDGLFWSFIESNEVFFRKQHRLGMMVRQLERMDAAKRMAHRRNAETFLKKLYA